ncbi:hypothetical protein FA95DRAFT_121280 [Auriscalpium vulgare]|uniref:Uncharacterized protein n=1 Tax=Auriscalpium vulgare TaxID=40419 RepID=A0ACB8R0X0_9AGAM|nr:hypothetical protein FA95DRAFT_121280 [Auriscalpium vulgare]
MRGCLFRSCVVTAALLRTRRQALSLRPVEPIHTGVTPWVLRSRHDRRIVFDEKGCCTVHRSCQSPSAFTVVARARISVLQHRASVYAARNRTHVTPARARPRTC